MRLHELFVDRVLRRRVLYRRLWIERRRTTGAYLVREVEGVLLPAGQKPTLTTLHGGFNETEAWRVYERRYLENVKWSLYMPPPP